MKRILTIATALLLAAAVWAQVPNNMSYQAVVRDANNTLVASQTVSMRISILQGSTIGTTVYTETHTLSTNSNGLVSLEIGAGTSTDDFSAIDWANGSYFIKTETDPTGGTTYTLSGTSQVLSVPYALHAAVADRVVGGIGIVDSAYIASLGFSATDNVNDADADASNEIQQLSANGDTIFISSTNYILLPGLSYLSSLLPPPVPIQERLDTGEAPIDIYNSDNSLLDSLYGKTYQGGIIAYLDTSDGSGLVAAPNDQSTGAPWGCQGTRIGTFHTIGSGATNTANIVATCDEAGIAARICDDLSLNGYDDWFLPSLNELLELYSNLHLNDLGGFTYNVSYWSSTDLGVDISASRVRFRTDVVTRGVLKSNSNYVRAVRTF